MSDEEPERASVIWRRLSTACLVAGAAFLSVVPYAYHLSFIGFPDLLARRFPASTPAEILGADLSLMALLVVIAALVGALFSERYGLAGLGGLDALRKTRRYWALFAPIAGVVSYFAFGQVLAERLPGYFPSGLVWAFAYAAKGAVFDEVVARYGMMTIVAGLAPKNVANVIQAVFFTALVFKGLDFFGIRASWDGYFVASLVSAFGLHLALGEVYARHGLWAAMAIHFAFDLRFVLHGGILLVGSGSG